MPLINKAVSESISASQYNIIIESVFRVDLLLVSMDTLKRVGVNALEFVHLYYKA